MECTISNPVLTIDWTLSGINSEVVAYFFGAMLLLWVTGLGVGLIVGVVRRTRI